MIGLGQIRQLEINREGFRDLVGARQVHSRDDLLCPEHQIGCENLLRSPAHRFSMLDQQASQFLHRFE